MIRRLALLSLFACSVLLGFNAASLAAEREVIDVWPGMAPGDTGDIGEESEAPPRAGAREVVRLTNVTKPTLKVYPAPADNNSGAAVVICPGGGYSILAWDLEGEEIAEWFNTIGVSAFVLKYRVPARPGLPRHQLPLMDAQRALGLVRSRASSWGIDPERIGVAGFSAGGHLSAALCHQGDERTYPHQDAADDVSCRPNFAVLVYPAYLAPEGTVGAEVAVGDNTPRTFLTHTSDDRLSAAQTALYYAALRNADIPAELHIYSRGGHGYGLRPSDDLSATWPARCAEWMRREELIPGK